MEPTSPPDPRWPAPSAGPLPPVPAMPTGRPARTHVQPRLWIGLTLLVVGLVLLVAGFVGLAVSPSPDDYPAVGVPGARSITLDEGTGYTLYVEWAGTEPNTPPAVSVTGPTGEVEPLLDPDPMAVDYTTLGDRQGRPFASIRPTVTGVYRFETQRPTGASGLLVTVGSDEGETASWIAFFAAGFGLVALAAGVIVLVVRAVRRRRPTPPVTSPPGAGASIPEPGR